MNGATAPTPRHTYQSSGRSGLATLPSAGGRDTRTQDTVFYIVRSASRPPFRDTRPVLEAQTRLKRVLIRQHLPHLRSALFHGELGYFLCYAPVGEAKGNV